MDEGLSKIRHERSRKDFPFLKLEDGEYVEFAFMRAKICLFLMFGGLTVGFGLVLLAFLAILMGQPTLDEMGRNFLYIILAAIVAAVLITSFFIATIYRGNRLFITNMRVIQRTMISPVSTSMNIIDLASIEDVSFSQNSIMQKLFHYGTFRLSTVGDETTYTFPYSDISPSDLKEVSKLVSESKKKKTSDEIIIY